MGATKLQEIKVKLTLTEGYEKRFTEACIRAAEKRRNKNQDKKEVA